MTDTATGPWREALGFIDILLTSDPGQREHLLAGLESSRPELHSRVRALLDADAQATRTGFLRVPSREGRTVREASLQAGSRLGPYRIERELGQGGMGEVWLARRDDGLYEGEVAIKTLHPYFAHGVMRERFLREAQLLGKLTHPHIARLLDAGVNEGVVYLVLEYVQGRPIDVYCDECALGVDARLELFEKVCAAVAHAHANLVIHRDIKPCNILVTGAGDVKLLDFGIGKLMDAEVAESSELTRVTGRIFTPEFAAPEQVRGEPVTTSTDVYSLGTLLYLLLSGSRPFGDATGARVEHALLHEEPRGLGAAAGTAGSEVAARRGLTPARLRRALSGDLEHIVNLALRKAPADRYGSVLALSEDLARFARHEPVRARAGSRAYRVDRFVRRHRVGVAAAIGVVLAAVVGMAGVLYQAREAREQARLAKVETAKATSVKDYLLEIFEANSARHPEGAQARQTTAEELMDIATGEILKEQSLDADTRLELMTILHNINGQMEKFPEQEALGKARIQIAEQSFGVSDLRLADALNDHGEFLRSRSRKEEALAAVNRAVALREAQGDSSSWTRGVSELELGKIHTSDWQGENDLPIVHFQRAIAILGALPPSDELQRSYIGLARAYEFKRDYPRAIEFNRKGIALGEQMTGPMNNGVAGGHQQLARVLAYSFRFEEAERHLNKAVEIFTFLHGADGGFTTNARLDVARLMNRRARFREAVEMLEPLLAKRLALDPPTSSWLRSIRSELATAYGGIGNFARARELLDTNREVYLRQKSVVSRAIGEGMLARLANLDGRPADALRYTESGLANLAQAPASRDRTHYFLRLERAEALLALGRRAEAKALMLEAGPLIAELDGDPERHDALRLQVLEARLHLAEGQIDVAREKARDALARLQASSRRAEAWAQEEMTQRQIASIEFAAQQPQAACRALDAAIALRSSHALATDPRLHAAKKLHQACTGKTAVSVLAVTAP